MARSWRSPGKHRKVRARSQRTQGRTEGRTEGRTQGRTKGRTQGLAAAMRGGIAAVLAGPQRITAVVAGHPRITAGTAAAVSLAGVAGGLLAFSPAASPAAGEAKVALSARRPPAADATELARLRSAAPRYARPGVRASGTVPASWYGYPSILPVIGSSPGWLEVRLAQRPDGSTAWIPATDATVSSTPYRIVINLADTQLALYDRGREVFSAPAGIGAPDDPTPPGQYFVAFTEPPPEPNPGYGPFILVTSDHSQAIGDWEGSGDAVIGIHGPLGASLAIGNTGARISHGCIRLQLKDQLKLAGIPAGTPITITG